MTKLNLLTPLAAIIAITSITSACRTARRSAKVNSDGPEVRITLSDLAAEDEGKADYAYKISGCAAGDETPGKLVEGQKNIVTFNIRGAKSGDVCDLKITSSASDLDKFAFSAEKGLLYWSRTVAIQQDPKGQLIGNAKLMKYYGKASPMDPSKPDPVPDVTKNFFVVAPVEFPETPAGDTKLVHGQLKCEPNIGQVGDLEMTPKPNIGSIKFTVPEDPSLTGKTVKCSSIVVYSNGTWTHEANITPPKEFAAVAGQTINVSEAPIKLKAVSTARASGITVETVEGKCADGEIYDLNQRKCIKK